MFWPIRRSEMAAGSRSGGTVCWVIACELGLPSADTHPATAPSTPSSHTLDQPPIRLAAANAWTIAVSVFEPCSITARETRSPSTPPNSVVATSAAENAATTSPSWVAEPPRSITANAKATGVIALPNALTVCAVSSSRYDGLVSGPRQRDRAFVVVSTGADYCCFELLSWQRPVVIWAEMSVLPGSVTGMDSKPVDEYDAEGVLDVVESLHRARVVGECRVLELAVQFAVVNNGDTLLPDGRRLPGRQRPVRLGGDGTPTVAEFAPAELGARMQQGPFAAKLLIADALDARFRLPRLWAQVQAGTARVPLVRAVAQATRHLTRAAAGAVDAALADLVDGRLPRARFDTVLTAQVAAADPETAAARERDAAERVFARASRSTEHAMKSFTLRAAAPVVIRFDATVAYLADALAALGDPDNEDNRRIKACLILANPTHAVQLLAAFAAHRATNPPPADDAGHEDADTGSEPENDDAEPGAAAGDAPTAPDLPAVCRPTPFRPADPVPPLHALATSGGYQLAPDKLLPSVTVYVHLSHETLVRDAGGVARFEGGDPITIDFVRRYLAPHHRFTITGILDLAAIAPPTATRSPPPTAPRSRSSPPPTPSPSPPPWPPTPAPPSTSTTPSTTSPSTTADHPASPESATTHPSAASTTASRPSAAWALRQPFPGIWIWRDPHGQHYLVDHTGTRKITAHPAPGHPTPAPTTPTSKPSSGTPPCAPHSTTPTSTPSPT